MVQSGETVENKLQLAAAQHASSNKSERITQTKQKGPTNFDFTGTGRRL